MRRLTGLGIILLGLTLGTAAKAASIDNVVPFEPASVSAPETLDREGRIRAIVRAFVMRSWRVTEINQQDGYVDAEYPIRVHVARVRAHLDQGRVTFEFRQSEKIEHGWKVRTEKHRDRPDELGRIGVEAWTWTLSDSPAGDESTFMVHPKYLEWVENVSRTLEGTFRLSTLPGS